MQCNTAVCGEMLRWLKGETSGGMAGGVAAGGVAPGGRLLLEPYCGTVVVVVVVVVVVAVVVGTTTLASTSTSTSTSATRARTLPSLRRTPSATPRAGNGNATLPLAASFDHVLASDLASLSVSAAATCVQLLHALAAPLRHTPQPQLLTINLSHTPAAP